MKILLFISGVCLSMAVHAQETQVLTLVKGGCNGAGCEFVFVDDAGIETRVDWIPEGVVKMENNANGESVVSAASLNHTFKLTFVLKKVYDEVSDTMMDDYVVQSITEIPKVIYSQPLQLVKAECEISPCIFTFRLPDGTELLAFVLPLENEILQTGADGKQELQKNALNATYETRYTLVKEYDYSTDTYFNALSISEIKKKN